MPVHHVIRLRQAVLRSSSGGRPNKVVRNLMSAACRKDHPD